MAFTAETFVSELPLDLQAKILSIHVDELESHGFSRPDIDAAMAIARDSRVGDFTPAFIFDLFNTDDQSF